MGELRTLVLLAWLLCSGCAFAAEVDCEDKEYSFDVLDVLDSAAEASKRQQALQGLMAHAECEGSGYTLGLLYRHGADLPGNPLPKDGVRARELILRSAEAGQILAYADLAELALSEKEPREAMKWAQVYLYFVKARKAFDSTVGSLERSGYNADLLFRAQQAWKKARPRLPHAAVQADFNEYLSRRKSSVLAAIDKADEALARTQEGGEGPESLSVKSQRACNAVVPESGYAMYLLEVFPDGHIGRVILENFAPKSGVAKELMACATVYTFNPFQGNKPLVARIPVFSGFGLGGRIR